MLNKIISQEQADCAPVSLANSIKMGKTKEPVIYFIRSAGEIGWNVLEYLMLRQNVAQKEAHPMEIHFITRKKYEGNLEADKIWKKATGTGSNYTELSNYPWAKIIAGIRHVEGNKFELVGNDRYANKSLVINVHFEDDTNIDLESLKETIACNQDKPVIIYDATGQVKHDSETQSPALYKAYPRLLSFISAPAKGAEYYIPHTLYGVNIGRFVPFQLNLKNATQASEPETVHTGSCTTHNVATLLHVLHKNIPGFKIVNGNVISSHIRTPSDRLPQLEENMIPGTTGFSAAYGKVTNVAGANQFAAVSTRINSAGSSFTSVSINFESDMPLTKEDILAFYTKEAQNEMAEQIGLIPEKVSGKKGVHNKKTFAVASSLGMKGIMITTLVDPTQVTLFKDPSADNRYTLVMNVNYYDNVGGFTYATLREQSIIADMRWDLAGKLFPPAVEAYSKEFMFINHRGERSNRMFMIDGQPMNISDRTNKIAGQLVAGVSLY